MRPERTSCDPVFTRGHQLFSLSHVFLLLMLVSLAHAQPASKDSASSPLTPSMNAACNDPSIHPAIKEALRVVCSRPPVNFGDPVGAKPIVVGLLGGFVKRDNRNHPEVWFARYLRSHYGPAIRVEIFGNHEWREAADYIAEQVDADKSHSSTGSVQGQAKVILYGHSWGSAQIVILARELERRAISVALTIQVDSVRRPGQNDHTIPANVVEAINYYQTKGLSPGQTTIVAADPQRTKILGNFRMVYTAHQINCGNYWWLSRWLNKAHHQIENDPQVWDRIASLIDAAVHPAQ